MINIRNVITLAWPTEKGGRPEKYSLDDVLYLQSKGLSQQDIVDNLGCDVKTVQRKLDQIKNNNTDDEI